MHRYPDWVELSTATACAAPNCSMVDGSAYKGAAAAEMGESVARRPVHGSELCIHHEKQLRRVLLDVARRLPDVRSAILRTQDKAGGGGASSTVADPVAQLWNPRASIVATQVQDYSNFMVGMVLNEYRSTAPDVEPDHGALRQGLDARVALVALSRWYGDWLARYPGGIGPDILRSVLELRRACEGALNGPGFRRLVLEGSRCGAVIEEFEQGTVLCEGQLVGILPNEGEQRVAEILCASNPEHRYPSDQWMAIANAREAPHG